MTALACSHWTKEQVLALPPADGTRFEVVAGELLVTPMPPPTHQRILGVLLMALADYLTPLGLVDTLLPGPADISWSDDDLVRPDIFVVDPTDLSRDWATFKRFRLVIEVLSWPASQRADRGPKRRLYLEHGVETYWVVDPDTSAVEVWHPGDAEGTSITDTLTWRVSPEAPELRVSLAEAFRIVG